MELKRLAQNARNRLIHKGEKDGLKKTRDVYSPNVKFKLISMEEDEEFTAKAKQVISDGSLNPIGELMDMTKYKSLSSSQKERYLFATLEKYARVKEKFDCEEERKLVC